MLNYWEITFSPNLYWLFGVIQLYYCKDLVFSYRSVQRKLKDITSSIFGKFLKIMEFILFFLIQGDRKVRPMKI